MGLIDIPPWLRAGDDPPNQTTWQRAYPLRSYQVVEPIAFPRDLFTDALAEHARLLDVHGAELLAAPLDRAGNPDDPEFVDLHELHYHSMLLVSDGVAHEVHRWHPVDLSYVVLRCRGIVRRIMEDPPEQHAYVVVVAEGVASLQLVRGVGPRRVGDAARLEIVERDLVVEPWHQWHLREGRFVATWWRTPVGELVGSRVRVGSWPGTAREVTEALLTLRGRSLRQRIDAFVRDEPEGKPLALLETGVGGEEIDVIDRRGGDPYVDPFPAIVEAVRVARPGLDPVVVHTDDWAALCWIPANASNDVAVPEPLIARRPPLAPERQAPEPRQTPSAAKPKTEPRLRLTTNEHLLATFDDFPPLDPWEARPSDVHAVWRMGLALALFVALALIGVGAVIAAWWDPMMRVLGVLLLATLFAGGTLGGLMLRARIRGLHPARRRRRWRAWKQVHDEMKGAARPAQPKPEVDDRKQWLRRLANRLSRLERLVVLDAPETIIDNERRMVREAIAELDKADADAVLAAWPAAARYLVPKAQRVAKNKGGTDKPN